MAVPGVRRPTWPPTVAQVGSGCPCTAIGRTSDFFGESLEPEL